MASRRIAISVNVKASRKHGGDDGGGSGGGGGGNTYRYWRVYWTGPTQDGVNSSIAEIEFRSSVGVGVTNPPATGVAIGGDFDSGIVGYAKAFTNSAADYWAKNGSSWNGLAWVGWDYGAGNTLNVVQVRLIAGPGTIAQGAPLSFKIEGSSNGSTWNTVKTVTGEANWGSNESRLYSVP